MSQLAIIEIHPSQFPENVRRDLLRSLRSRKLNHKFLYDSIKQTQKWLALHEALSPARNNRDCAAIYRRAFEAMAGKVSGQAVHVLGLGCGGGQKDTSLLKQLKSNRGKIFYTPCDVSVAMVLVAWKTALAILPEQNCFPLVCDLETADDLRAVCDSRLTPHASRLTTFFGMIPNFEPRPVLSKLAALLRSNDWLLFSANLAPGKSYEAGLKKILPQYDNSLTHDWLMTFLLDLGVDRSDGKLQFHIEDDLSDKDLKRVSAHFNFLRSRKIQIDRTQIIFRKGESFRLLFSYRYRPQQIESLLERHGFAVLNQWITKSEEEGVFLCRRR